ncbi:MAG: hypothetical protein LC121_15415 [Anaerolineae bacterium]|nr:hypothetical protein [Anaerolineae bacterium]
MWERSDEQILNALKVDLLPVIGDAQIVEAQLKRWRYSQPEQIYPERCFVAADLPAPLVFAAMRWQPRVEGAALSGMAAGRKRSSCLEIARNFWARHVVPLQHISSGFTSRASTAAIA